MWKVPKYRVFCGSYTPYLSVSVRMRENTDQKTPYLDTFYAVSMNNTKY